MVLRVSSIPVTVTCAAATLQETYGCHTSENNNNNNKYKCVINVDRIYVRSAPQFGKTIYHPYSVRQLITIPNSTTVVRSVDNSVTHNLIVNHIFVLYTYPFRYIGDIESRGK